MTLKGSVIYYRFSNHQRFQDLVMELNNCATHREVMAESMTQGICNDLSKYLHEVKQERRNVKEIRLGSVMERLLRNP